MRKIEEYMFKQLEENNLLEDCLSPEEAVDSFRNIINNYCIKTKIVPIYPLWPKRTKKMNMLIEDVSWGFVEKYPVPSLTLETETNIFEDITKFKTELGENEPDNKEKYISFIRGCIDKYGVSRTKYLFNHIFIHALSYK